MYYYLTREVKRRFIDELKEIVKTYPGLGKMKVSDKFPTDERPQFGVLVKNMSAGTIPLAADNFIGTMKSYCLLASLKGKKSLLIDWVKEETGLITKKIVNEDLSSQVSLHNQLFDLAEKPVSGFGNLEPAISPKQVTIKVNGEKVSVLSISGQRVTLVKSPNPGDVVTADYFVKNLAAPGLYYFEVIAPNVVAVDPLLQFNEIIIPESTGSEMTYTLPFPVYSDTLVITENDFSVLQEGVHYQISGQIITWLPNPQEPSETLRPGQKYRAEFRYQAPTLGEFQIKPLQQYEILPGVVTSFSNWIEVGDKQVVIVTENREDAAHEFGGHFDTTVSLEVYSRDPIQRELIADLLAVKIFGEFKPIFDAIGLLVISVSINGEMEDMYDENTDTVYYMAGIDIQLQTDWRIYAPLLPKIRFLSVDVELVESVNKFTASFVHKQESYR